MEYKEEKTLIGLIAIDLLEENVGQLAGLPENPREINDEKFELLKSDIQRYPEFLHINALKVYPLDKGNYIVVGGNMRLKALKALGYESVPCVVIPKETEVERLKAYTVLDNSQFGCWDWLKLSSDEWDKAQLGNWGVKLPEEWSISPDEFGNEFTLPQGDKKPFQQMTFTFADEQAALIKSCIKQIDEEEGGCRQTFGNENKNGNALYEIVRQWAEQKR